MAEPPRHRIVLVPRDEDQAASADPRPAVRRYSLARLARLGPSPRSALGADRLERMENIAFKGSDPS